MPKNLKGGSRHKKQAKKHNIVQSKSKLRLAKEDGEIYARVVSLYGNGMAEVICNDCVKRLLIIRRRFKGRNRRDNEVSIDKMLLVGLREWEVIAEKKKEKVDLLYVYSNDDIEDIKNDGNLNMDILPDSLKIAINEDSGFDITNKRNWSQEYEKEQNDKKEKNIIDDAPDFDFDDI